MTIQTNDIKPESIIENKTHNILWDFEIKMDHPVSDRRPDQVLTYKKKELVDFAVPADHRVKIKENEKIENTWTLTEN